MLMSVSYRCSLESFNSKPFREKFPVVEFRWDGGVANFSNVMWMLSWPIFFLMPYSWSRY